MAVELNVVVFRRRRLPRTELVVTTHAAGGVLLPNTAVTEVGGLVHKHLTKFPPNRVVVSLYQYMKFVR